MNKDSRNERGFLLLEVLLAMAVMITALVIFFNLFKPVIRLQTMAGARANLTENQIVVMQHIVQQVNWYSSKVMVTSERLTCYDVSGNRLIAFYRAQESAAGVGVLYINTTVGADLPGVNQLTDPYNVNVEEFKVYKINNKIIFLTMQLRDIKTNTVKQHTEYVTIYNGEVL